MILKLLVILVILKFLFKFSFKKFRDGAVDIVIVSYYVYVNMGLCLDEIVCLKLGSTV